MISNELLEEVISVSKNKKFISKGLLLRIVVNVIENSNDVTKSKFQDFRCGELGWDFAVAAGDKENGIVYLNYDKALHLEKNKHVFSYLKSNLNIIQIILHEIEHLNELYKIEKNNFESKFIIKSVSDLISEKCFEIGKNLFDNRDEAIYYRNMRYRMFYEKYWDIIPTEKIAELDSYEKLIRSLDKYPNFYNNHPKIYEYFVEEYINSLKLGYNSKEEIEKYNIPLIDYLSALKTINCRLYLEDFGVSLKTKTSSGNIPLEKRMRYGLPVTKQEIEELDINKILLKSTK